MAYVVRLSGAIPADVSFLAPSIGIVAQCQPITPQCFSSQQLEPGQSYYNSSSGITYNCSDAGYPEYAKSLETAFSVPHSQFTDDSEINPPFPLVSNPFTAVYQNYLQDEMDSYPFKDSLVGVSTDVGISSFLIMACNISVYEITILYNNGSYSMFNETLASAETAGFATFPFVQNSASNYFGSEYDTKVDILFPIIPRIESDIQLSKAASSAEFVDQLSADIARLTLAFSTGYLQTVPPLKTTTIGVVTRYPIIPLGIDLLFIYAYSALALFIFIWASAARFTGPRNQQPMNKKLVSKLAYNAQLHISQPSSLVAALFGSKVAQRQTSTYQPGGLVEGDVDELFGNEKSGIMRLKIGLRQGGDQQAATYGVWKPGPGE